MILPRARLRLIPPPVKRLLAQLGVTPADGEDASLLARLAPPPPPGPERAWLAEVEARLDAYAVDRRDVARARRSIEHAIDRLARRHRLASVARETALAERVRRLHEWLLHGGVPQERVLGVPWFAAHAGISCLQQQISTHAAIFNANTQYSTMALNFNADVKDIDL